MPTQWFELEEPDGYLDLEITEPERAFVEALRSHTAQWPSQGAGGKISRLETGDVLLAYITLSDPETRLSLIDIGVHLSGDQIRGDRLHNQLFTLPDRPSAWALNAEGSTRELAWRTAEWMRTALHRPVVLYVWLHDGYAYAGRYAFVDRDETLSQLYNASKRPMGRQKRSRRRAMSTAGAGSRPLACRRPTSTFTSAATSTRLRCRPPSEPPPGAAPSPGSGTSSSRLLPSGFGTTLRQ